MSWFLISNLAVLHKHKGIVLRLKNLSTTSNSVQSKSTAMAPHPIRGAMRETLVSIGLVLVAVVSGCAVEDTPALPEAAGLAPNLPRVSSESSAAIPYDEELPSVSLGVGAEATTLARAVVAALCRPALDRETWINDLYPFLSQPAAVAYGTVNPARVPCRTVTGDARVRDGDGTFTIRVIVPTDGGDYSVYVHRPKVSDPWLVEQVIPLAGT